MRQKLGLLFILGIFLLHTSPTYTQNTLSSGTPVQGDSLYQANILKSTLYGVYIPRDFPDAMQQLDKLTDVAAREKLKQIDEKTMARKLFFGLGRWMEYNWNFQEGSRLSHLLRKKGITYTEDMTYTMLVLYHRHVTGKPLDANNLIREVTAARKEKVAAEKKNAVVVDSFKVVVPKK